MARQMDIKYYKKMLVSSIFFIIIIVISILVYSIKIDKTLKDKSVYNIPLLNNQIALSLPVVYFNWEDTPLFFIVDTGASESLLHEEIFNEKINPFLKHPIKEEVVHLLGIAGKTTHSVRICSLDLVYKNLKFNSDFKIINLKDSIQHINEQLGIECAGVIGLSFLRKYKMKLNFKQNTLVVARHDLLHK